MKNRFLNSFFGMIGWMMIMMVTKFNQLSGEAVNKLQQAYVKGGGGGSLISQADVEKIGTILENEYVNKGKKFTTTTVAEIIKKLNLLPDAQKKAKPEVYIKNKAYAVLVRLGVIVPKKKEAVQEKE